MKEVQKWTCLWRSVEGQLVSWCRYTSISRQ